MTKKRKAKIFKALGFTRLPYSPYILNIEPGNICNLKCPLCPTGSDDPGLQKGFLKLGLFRKIFDQLKRNLSVVNLYSWGEPLLNKDLVPIIKYIKEYDKSIRVITSTNLNVQDKQLLSELALSGIDEIIVSIDGASAQTYNKYRVGGDFRLVMENLESLARIKKEHNTKTSIVWNFLVFRHNEHEVEKARQNASDLGVDFRIGLMRTTMKDEILKPHADSIKKDIGWIPDNPQYSAYDKQKLTTKKKISTCRKPWQEISINWDGKVFACCAIYDSKHAFGDANETGLENIWNNRLYVAARRSILGKNEKLETICGLCRKNGFMHM